jgi:hypothetical protein
MLSTKWRVYKVLSYVQLCYTFLLLLWFGWFVIFMPLGFRNTLLFFVVGIVIVLMAVGPLINIILISKNFPDKPLTVNQTTFYIFSVSANIIASSLLILYSTLGFISEFGPKDEYSQSLTGKIILAFLCIITFINLYLLVMQFGMRRFLKRNYMTSISSQLDSLGASIPENNSE